MLEFDTYLEALHDFQNSDECVLIGLGLELPKLLLKMNFKKVIVAEADLAKIEKIEKFYDFPENFINTNELVYKDDVDVKFQIASNSSANTFGDIENFREIYPNIKLIETLEKPSVSLDRFVSNYEVKNAKWLFLNTLNSKEILEINNLARFDVVICKIEKSQLNDVQAKLKLNNFKYLRYFEKENPKILWSIFVKDTQKLLTKKEQELEVLQKLSIQKSIDSFNSKEYWNERYQKGGNSGNGSYGRLAVFKAEVINGFINEKGIDKLIDFGCGDGNQLSMYNINKYIGVDASDVIIKKHKAKYKDNDNKEFYTIQDFKNQNLKANLTLSIDVIYHLIEDSVFEEYMNTLLDSSNQYSIIYSTNNSNMSNPAQHVKHRAFIEWIRNNRKDWDILEKVYNRYYDKEVLTSEEYSFCNFYILKRK